MTSKRKKGRPAKQGKIPMLVMRQQFDTELQLKEYSAVTALRLGYAEPDHYDTLLYMQGLLLVACALEKKEVNAPVAAFVRNVVGQVLANMKIRFEEVNKVGVSGPELEVLQVFPVVYRDFWTTKSINLYKQATDILERIYSGTATQADVEMIELKELVNGN